MKKVFLGLGSNMGDRENYLIQAVNQINCHPQISVTNQSSIYQTKPFGFKEQADFLNMVIHIETDLLPHQLLEVTQRIELELGRERHIHWGPRTIDIDILLYENQVVHTDILKIPHPLMKERLFILKPLSDIYSGPIPKEERSLQNLIDQLQFEEEGVKKWKTQTGKFERFEN